MALMGFIVLFTLLSKCLGHTEFIYTEKDQVKLVCNTSIWQISPNFNNRIEENCTVECGPDASLKFNNIKNPCNDKIYSADKCSLRAENGFFRCVTALAVGFLFPFKPSPNTVTSYIIARANEEMTTKPEERSSLKITEGEDVLLNCTFNFTTQYANQEFVLYWIKKSKNNSDCVYSYDFDFSAIKYNHHCNVSEELLHRISNQSQGRNTHNIRISNVTESDTGQYLCALQVHIPDQTKGNWKIINNITVSLNNGGSKPAGNTVGLIPLYGIIPILLAFTIITVVCIWKKTKTSSRSQIVRQRNHNVGDTEDAADIECSPYAVGCGEDEIKFKSKSDTSKQDEKETSSTLYSVMKQNDLYESGV